MKRRRVLLVLSVAACLVAVAGVSGWPYSDPQRSQAKSKTVETVTTPADTAPDTTNPAAAVPSFNKSQFSLTDPTSVWVIVNKQRPLTPKTYAPDDLIVPSIQLRSNITSNERLVRAAPAAALRQLFDAAKANGITLVAQSGYRSYSLQTSVYNRYVQQQGLATADSQSARPGHSEHQTGLAMDVGGITKPACNVEPCFADTPEGKWVAVHAHEHGFVIRYPDGKAATTGYIYEPWHLRYVGPELAREIHATQIPTLEEFFGLPAAPDYK